MHSKQGATFQNSRRQEENTRSKYDYCIPGIYTRIYVQKEGDFSKPSVDKKPDIGSWPGVVPTNKNLRLTPNSRFLLAGLYVLLVVLMLQQLYSQTSDQK